MSALRAAGDVVIVSATFGAITATGLTARTDAGIVWGFVATIFAACAALILWDVFCDHRETPAARDDLREASRSWTPADAREYRNVTGDAWADDPDRTTRRETWEH